MVDVSIRISLLNMLLRLRDELSVTFVFVTHDLSLAKYFAWDGRIAVMYVGRIVELAPTPAADRTFPRHPYTRALLSAIPEADPKLTRSKERLELRSHDIPSLLQLPSGLHVSSPLPLAPAGSLRRCGARETISCGTGGKSHATSSCARRGEAG